MPVEQKKMVVTNGNNEVFEDSFDGVVYRFEPKRSIGVPIYALNHIFGYPVEGVSDWAMFVDLNPDTIQEKLVRRGWGSPNGASLADGIAWIKKFNFKEGKFVAVDDAGAVIGKT